MAERRRGVLRVLLCVTLSTLPLPLALLLLLPFDVVVVLAASSLDPLHAEARSRSELRRANVRRERR